MERVNGHGVQQRGDVETGKGRDCTDRKSDREMPVGVMPEFMRKDTDDFIIREFPQECIAEDNAPGFPYPREPRVCFLCVLAQIEREDSAEAGPRAGAEGGKTIEQRSFRKRG